MHDVEGFVFSKFDVEELKGLEGIYLLEAVVGEGNAIGRDMVMDQE